MKGIVLTMKENDKFEVIKKLVDNNGNKNNAAIKLGLSKRSINRLILNYKKFGKVAFRHKNHDNKPAIAINQSTKDLIVHLYSSKYSGFNFSHFNEFLKSHESIFVSYSALRNILSSHGFISPKARRITKRNAAFNSHSNNTKAGDDLLVSNMKYLLKILILDKNVPSTLVNSFKWMLLLDEL